MTAPPRDLVARVVSAFSGHRFAEAYDHIATSARWVVHGGPTYDGRDAIIAACEEARPELDTGTSEFLRFVVIVDGPRAAVDAVGRDGDGEVRVVASCDLYEFADDEISVITSYAVEIDEAR